MGRACGTYGEDEIFIPDFGGKKKTRDHLEDTNVDGKKIQSNL
jgi:hypothetical protein